MWATDARMSHRIITEMFKAVDACDWRALSLLYAEDCVYERPGFPRIQGRDALTRFYVEARPIRAGRHTLSLFIEEGAQLCAAGAFMGVLRSGENISLKFADIYLLSDGLIGHRTTFFHTPLA
jgi:ketosteroid isomerase-like protein